MFRDLAELFIAAYTIIMLAKMASNILKSEYWARIDSKVVNEPAPAIRGNTTGVKVASFPISVFWRKIDISNTISMAMINTIIEPATANEEISRLNKR